MPILPRIASTFRSIFRKEMIEKELDQELESYVDHLTDRKIKEGLSPAEALRQARMELGGTEQVKQKVRERSLGSGLDTLLLDIRFTLRNIRNHPGFTFTVVLILAIGIGANTALFSSVNAVLLRSVPFGDSEQLIVGRKTNEGRITGAVSRLDYYDYRDHNKTFDHLAALLNGSYPRVVMINDTPQLLNAGMVTWNLLSVLGVAPAAGRDFLPQDDLAEGSTVAMISYRTWQTQFGASRDAIGSTVSFDGTPFTIVGVMPHDFRFLYDHDVWTLIDRSGQIDMQRDAHSLLVVGRMRSGVTLEQAQGDADTISAGLQQEYPDTNADKALNLTGMHDYMVRNVRSSLTMLMATTVLVLLIACGNVAGLLLARGQRRLPEMAMRAALGAPRNRLIRQLLTESLFITMLAGLAGIAVAHAFRVLLLNLLPIGAVGIAPPTLDASSLIFAFGISIVTALLVGIVPALRATTVGPARQIVSGARVSEGVQSARLRSGLVVMQVAGSILLLIGSALLIRSLGQLSHVNLGFDSENLLTARIQIQQTDYETPEERHQFFSSLMERISAMPGVVSATTITKLPILNPWQDWPVWPADQPRPSNTERQFAMARWTTPNYFDTIGIQLLRGRDISVDDLPQSQRVVVLSESTVEALFPDQDPIGKYVGIGWDEEPWRVIGVVSEARLNRITDVPNGAMYMPSAQLGASILRLAVKTTGKPMALVGPIRETIRQLDANAILSEEASMTSILDAELASFRIVILSIGLFSAIALMLTAIGLYGVLAYHIAQRFREIGIRMALGAEPASLVRRYVFRGLALVGSGLLLGVLSAFPCSKLMADLLFGIEPFDPASFISAFAFLTIVGIVACLIPALRATRVNPAQILREQ
ncbi:MAG: ABC transporter permease [bacterium]|nr:ABC transporter permease [bacterium]